MHLIQADPGMHGHVADMHPWKICMHVSGTWVRSVMTSQSSHACAVVVILIEMHWAEFFFNRTLGRGLTLQALDPSSEES